jgi:hypothetical protein
MMRLALQGLGAKHHGMLTSMLVKESLKMQGLVLTRIQLLFERPKSS